MSNTVKFLSVHPLCGGYQESMSSLFFVHVMLVCTRGWYIKMIAWFSLFFPYFFSEISIFYMVMPCIIVHLWKYIYTLKSKYCLFYLLMVLWRMLCPFHPQQVTKKILQGSSFCLTVWWSLGDLADYKKIYIEVTNMSKLFRCIKS